MLVFYPYTFLKIFVLTLGLAGCSPSPQQQATDTAEPRTNDALATAEHFDDESNETQPQRMAAVRSSENHPDAQPVPQPKGYTFDAPDAVIKLDKKLKEISGLTLLDDKHLAAVQDEKGKIYVLNVENGEISDDKRFAKDGDFEGIELAGTLLYALRSDGDLYEITEWGTKDANTEKFETHLSTKNDTEGLTFDAKNNRLLVVCKEEPGAGLKQARAVYAFDLTTKKMGKDPVLVVDLKAVEALTEKNKLNRIVRNLAAPLTNLSGFKPAAIAIHPITGQLFIISSVRKVLLAYNMDGTLEDVWLLGEDDFRQPEGLAFLPNGDLFIANEGGGGSATLMRFNYQ